MERTTFCLLFYIRRTKLNRNGEAPIMMRITVNGVRVDASVKKTILPEFWSAAKGKALEKKREYKELNLYLDSIRLRIMKIQRELEIEEVSVSANSVLDRFQGKDAPVQRTLFEVFREHNDKCVQLSGTDMAPATVQRYETSLKHTRDFVWETYHKKDVLLDEVSRQFIEDYEFWLKTEKKCCHNTATKYLKNFKITVKNGKGKKIGVYSAKKLTINLKSGKSKAYTFKIKKSKLKIKKTQDLRNASYPKSTGKYYYTNR